MMNFLNEHFGALSALFMLTLMIITEWKEKPSNESGSSSNLRYQGISNAMLFWMKIVVLLQSVLVLFSILNYFK